MALPTREGRFKATIGQHAVNEVGPNQLAAFVCEYHLTQELVGGQWVPIDEENFSITGYHFLEKRDGSVNDVTIDQLKEAFGWDGRDPFWLADTDFAGGSGGGHVVQVKLGFEQYNGQQRIKVQFVNPEDWQGGGVSQADDTTRRSIQSRLGSRLRAHAGGSPANAPKPSNPSQSAAPAPAPAPSAVTATAPPPATSQPPSPSSLEEAWEAFVQACPEKWDRSHIEKEWFAVLGALVPGKQPEQFTPRDWGLVRDQGPDKITPF